MSLSNPSEEEIQRLRDASDWVVRLHESHDPALLEECMQWCAQHALNRPALARMQAVWSGLGAARRPAAARHRAPGRSGLLVAACLAGLLAVAGWLLAGSFDGRTLSAVAGAPRHFTLADGSLLDLAPESRVSLRFSPRRRDVRLEQGQAYFTVAPGGWRPFVVAAGGLTATATAAAFDVRTRPTGAVVAVSRGRVRVQAAGQGADATVYAAAGQQVSFSAAAPCCSVTALAPRVAGSWRTGVLQFIGEPLNEVVTEVNRYVQHRIVLGPAARDVRFTGTVAPEHADEFIEALRQIYFVHILKEDAHAIAVAR